MNEAMENQSRCITKTPHLDGPKQTLDALLQTILNLATTSGFKFGVNANHRCIFTYYTVRGGNNALNFTL